MAEKIKLADLYSTHLTPQQKKNLLNYYVDYVSHIRNLEYILKNYELSTMATHQYLYMFESKDEIDRWVLKRPTKEDTENYHNFMKRNSTNQSEPYAYINVNQFRNPQGTEISEIQMTPAQYHTMFRQNNIPSNIENWILMYRENQPLHGTKFIINGQWMLQYNDENDTRTVEQLFDTPMAADRLNARLNLLLSITPNYEYLDKQAINSNQTEILASTLVEPYENIILKTLGNLAEENNAIARQIYASRYDEKYMSQAENDGIISSASTLQDYLNIRHLMHHQWDTLDGVKHFSISDKQDKENLRKRFLDSYSRICDGKLPERLKSYLKAAQDFAPVVEMFNPNLLRRNINESNTKFIERIKNFVKNHPDMPLYVELNFNQSKDKNDKTKSLSQKIKKISPNAQIIDGARFDLNSFFARTTDYLIMLEYLRTYQQIEYKLHQYCLLNGKNYSKSAALNFARRQKILSYAEAQKWEEYRQLRNALSHNYLTADLIKQMKDTFIDFYTASQVLDKKILKSMPNLLSVSDNVYQAIHKDGTIVNIDYNNQTITVLNKEQIKAPNQTTQQGNKHKKHSPKLFTEEYPNGLGITLSGAEIVSCRLPNGTVINLKEKNIIYPDNSKLYFNSDEHNSLILPEGIKIMTDKTMKIVNYIERGKSINNQGASTVAFRNSHTLSTNNKGRIIKESIKSAKISYILNQKNIPEMHFSDGTVIILNPQTPQLQHNGIALTYSNRKEFADSYKSTPTLQNNKINTGR